MKETEVMRSDSGVEDREWQRRRPRGLEGVGMGLEMSVSGWEATTVGLTRPSWHPGSHCSCVPSEQWVCLMCVAG